MATVILTVVGSILGGPVGGAIGAAIGQQIDGAIIGSGKPREGPRLKELEVQTSSYGTQVPAIFGAMRVAGTVFWSTDLVERRQKSGGGKGRPSTVNYSYSVSFAVALSSRPIGRVGRIWADGNLLRGAAGDFKTDTEFRFHNGFGDQPLDPLLASAEASGQCPAHRDLAYAVFEDLQLADFGNRIPSLTFELFERDAAVPVRDIAMVASQGVIMGQSNETLHGYALQGGDVRTALSPIFSSFPILTRPFGDHLELFDWSGPTNSAVSASAALADGKAKLERPDRSRGADSSAPGFVSIRHYEPARDFQAGVQCSRRLGGARAEMQIDLPVAISAPSAKRLADLQLLQRRYGLNGRALSIPVSPSPLRAGDFLDNQARITEVEHMRGTMRLVAQDWVDSTLSGAITANAGRNQPQPDLAAGETRLLLVELPALGTEDPARAVIAVAAAGTSAGWRRAALSFRDGARWTDIGATNGVAVMGNLLAPVPRHSANVEDRSNALIVRLLHDAMTLPTGTGSALSYDAPTIWLAGELIRYGRAEKIGARDYQLSGLLRSCFGTSEVMTPHLAGADLLLLDETALLVLDSIPAPAGAVVEIEALGIADPAPVAASVIVSGLAVTPRKPLHGRSEKLANGDMLLSWTRRDRLASVWTDAVDAPNAEGLQEYAITLSIAGLVRANWNVAEPQLSITASELAAMSILAGSTLSFAISQVGRFAKSAPLIIDAIG
jgi:Putative phage tail protein